MGNQRRHEKSSLPARDVPPSDRRGGPYSIRQIINDVIARSQESYRRRFLSGVTLFVIAVLFLTLPHAQYPASNPPDPAD